MLRKLIVFAITSGLAKKAYDHYRARQAAVPQAAGPRSASDTNAAYAQPVAPASPMHYN